MLQESFDFQKQKQQTLRSLTSYLISDDIAMRNKSLTDGFVKNDLCLAQ